MVTSLAERLEAHRSRLSPAALRVVEFLVQHPAVAATAAAAEIAQQVGTSDATVVRSVQILGYTGLPELRRSLGEEWAIKQNPRETLRRRVALVKGDPGSVLDAVLADGIDMLAEMRAIADHAVFLDAVASLAQARRVIVLGFGPPGALAEYMALNLSRIGKPARAETQSGFRLADGLAGLTGHDALLVLAPLRHLREIDVALDRARAVGARTVLVSELLAEKLRGHVDQAIVTANSRGRVANESLALMVILDAMLLGVSASQPDESLSSWERINELRAALTGQDIDLPPVWRGETPTDASPRDK
ncbi:MAG: MurR/RpiR family transcriptional regulator [Pseudonocardia sp.]